MVSVSALSMNVALRCFEFAHLALELSPDNWDGHDVTWYDSVASFVVLLLTCNG